MNFDTLFPDVRETGETPLRQSQLVMLRLLKIFDYLCLKHNIKYFLTGGSLLGAVRHQGFIPWDDDLDVGMTWQNYEKFIKYAVPELPNDIFFQNPETDPWYPSARVVEAKLRDKYSSYPEPNWNKSKPNRWHYGIMLDINVYYKAYLPHNFFLYALNRPLTYFFWKIGPNNTNNQKRAKVLKAIERYSLVPLVYASAFIWKWKSIKLGQSYKRPKEIEDVIRANFENTQVYIPAGWHAYLKRMYGDYMQLPPEEKRRGHYGNRLPDAFTPCKHQETLNWNDRQKTHTPTTNKMPLNEF